MRKRFLYPKKQIKCISYEEQDKGGEITLTYRNYLGNRKEFGLDKDTIIQFCDFAVRFFDAVKQNGGYKYSV